MKRFSEKLPCLILIDSWETEASDASAAEKTRSPENIAKDANGFGGLSRRIKSCKPFIAAVEGGAFGGGVEILLNCDLVISDNTATFALPEVRVGVTASSGGKYLFRLVYGSNDTRGRDSETVQQRWTAGNEMHRSCNFVSLNYYSSRPRC